jgi:hypothetical protein
LSADDPAQGAEWTRQTRKKEIPILADALLVRGIRTEDIMSATRRTVHTLTPFAKVRGTTITYPAEVLRSNPIDLSKRLDGNQTVRLG